MEEVEYGIGVEGWIVIGKCEVRCMRRTVWLELREHVCKGWVGRCGPS